VTLVEKEHIAMSEAEQEEKHEITLSVDWHIPESIQGQYTNNILVQAGQFEFNIFFFEMQQPILSGSSEENKAKLEEMKSIQARCVSKVVLSPELIPGFINALQTELVKYQSQRSNQ